jgi:hypothetical protein
MELIPELLRGSTYVVGYSRQGQNREPEGFIWHCGEQHTEHCYIGTGWLKLASHFFVALAGNNRVLHIVTTTGLIG